MNDQLTFAHARNSDPETSHAAAASVTDLTQKQAAVFRVLSSNGPMTDEQLVKSYRRSVMYGPTTHQSESGIRTRRSELVALGLVEATDERRVTSSGRAAIVWAAV